MWCSDRGKALPIILSLEDRIRPYFENDVIQYAPGQSGQWVKDDGTILIGDRAGPSRDPEYLLHEMAHFAEIELERARLYGWGLTYPMFYNSYDKYCSYVPNPTTCAGVERECRVLAYQYSIAKRIGIRIDLVSGVESLSFMPDFLNVPSIQYPVPEELYSIRDNWIRKPMPWIWRRVQQNLETYTVDRFNAEWKHRIHVLGVSNGTSGSQR